jgi:hypothetical protein
LVNYNKQAKYQELVNKDSRTLDEIEQLKKITLELYQLAYIKNINKLNQILKTVEKSIIDKRKLVYKPGSVYTMNLFHPLFSNQKQLSKAG